jgi:hypothetical protein
MKLQNSFCDFCEISAISAGKIGCRKPFPKRKAAESLPQLLAFDF